MIFTISIGMNAKEERLVEELDVNGTKLVFQTGKLEFEALRANFQCRVPIVTEVRCLLKFCTNFCASKQLFRLRLNAPATPRLGSTQHGLNKHYAAVIINNEMKTI